MIYRILFLSYFSFISMVDAAFETPRGLALSGALRGTVGLNEALYFNPASFAFANRYSIQAESAYVSSTFETDPTWTFGGSIIDTHTSRLAGGFGYFHKTAHGMDGKQVDQDYRLAFSRIFWNIASFGVGGKYIISDGPKKNDDIFDIDIGNFIIVSQRIQLGLVGHNLFAADVDYPRQIGIGSRFALMEIMHLSIDLLKIVQGGIADHLSLHSGFEVTHKEGILFQAGTALAEESSKNVYSVGLGWSQHKSGIFYAFQNSMDGRARMTHSLSLRVFY